MDFIALVKEKASALTISAVKTSGAVVETVKSNFAIADKEQEIKNIYTGIGKMMYDAYKAGEEPNADTIAEQCVLLDEYFEEINELKNKINDIKNVKTCPVCGEKVKADHNFCPKCGKNMEDIEAIEVAE